MSLPYLLWSELFLGFTRYDAMPESTGLSRLSWAPGRSYILLHAPNMPEIKLHVDREIACTKYTVIENAIKHRGRIVMSWEYIPHRKLSWVEELRCDFGRGSKTRRTISLSLPLKKAGEHQLYKDFTLWMGTNIISRRLSSLKAEEAEQLWERHSVPPIIIQSPVRESSSLVAPVVSAPEKAHPVKKLKKLRPRHMINLTGLIGPKVIEQLDEGELGDDVVFFYLEICYRALEKTSTAPIMVFSTQFVHMLEVHKSPMERYYAVCNNVYCDLFTQDFLIFPVHNALMGHWYLVIVDRPMNMVSIEGTTSWIYILDSLRDVPPLNIVSLIKEFLEWEAKTRFGLKLDPNRFSIQHTHVPQQDNGVDCALFACHFARMFMNNPDCFRLHFEEQRNLGEEHGRSLSERRQTHANKLWQSHLLQTMRSDIQRMILDEKAGDERTMKILYDRFLGHRFGSDDISID